MDRFPDDSFLNEGFEAAGYRLVSDDDLEQGETALLGEGEQGRVYRVLRESINREFAAKIVIPKGAEFTEKEISRFYREVAIMAQLGDSPHVVAVVDRFDMGKTVLCYVMEYIRAKNLKQLLAERQFESDRGPDHMIDIFWQLSKGLWTLHANSIAHRDLKQANILIPKDIIGSYSVIIADFGFGYNYGESPGDQPSPLQAKQHSSHAREGAQDGIKGASLDFYCFHRIIDDILSSNEKLRRSNLSNGLRDLSSRLWKISTDNPDPHDPKNMVLFDEEINKQLASLSATAGTLRIDPEYGRLLVVPELTDVGDGDVIRLSGNITVPLTRRIIMLLDSPPFQRLKCVPQLANVDYVYPGASHSRFEHSIGVFNIARIVMRRLLQAAGPKFLDITREDIDKILLAALLHDIGHVPYGHVIEEAELLEYNHESAAKDIVLSEPISGIISSSWDLDPKKVSVLIEKAHHSRPTDQVLRSILGHAIDIDTMDYLRRDSIHLGVPYGNSFDIDRLIFSLTINETRDGLAVTHKGVIPAETFLIARYAMFSQVYSHHTVRAVTAMLHRALLEKLKKTDANLILNNLTGTNCCNMSFLRFIAGDDTDSPEFSIIGPLAKNQRKIYKRFFIISEELHESLINLNYQKRTEISDGIVKILNINGLKELKPWDLLIDIPKTKFQKVTMQVFNSKTSSYEPIGPKSPLIHALGEGFERNTGKARVFVSSKLIREKIESVKKPHQIEQIIRGFL